jgi:gluconokinase
MHRPIIILVMGVAGSGKSTLGAALAAALGWEFIEADQFHPPNNIRKMAAALPLTDEDRRPWLDSLRALVDERLARGQPAVLACSALRQAYRDVLRSGHEESIPVVYLRADPETIRHRLAARRGHYMGPAMADSQFQTLEEPADAVVVPVEMAIDGAIAAIRQQLNI